MKSAKYLVLLFLIGTELFFGVTCKSIPNNIIQEIASGKGPGSCATVKFLVESNFTKSCVLETFPVNITKLENQQSKTILCLALYDYSSKWCSRSSMHIVLPEFANATEFDSSVAKFATDKSIESFCNQQKVPINSTLKVELENLYNNPSRCAKYCLYKPTEICSALSYLDHMLETHNEIRPAFTEIKNLPTGDEKTAKKNTEAKITGEKTDKPKSPKAEPKVEDKMDRKMSSKLTDQQSLKGLGKGSSTISNDKTSSVVAQKENEKLPSLANTEAESEKIKDSTTKNVNQGSQNLRKDNPVKQEVALPPETKQEVIEEVENTEGKPPSAEEASTIGKKPEVKNEMLAKEPKAGEVKSNTLSENTDDLNENLGMGGEDSDVQAQAAENEEDLPEETGSSNQIQEISPQREVFTHYHSTVTEDESHFFSYLVVLSLAFVCCYIAYHNKKKIFAILLEGRRSRSGRGRRRPSTANYRKLDCNLEEAVTSQCNSNVTHVIY